MVRFDRPAWLDNVAAPLLQHTHALRRRVHAQGRPDLATAARVVGFVVLCTVVCGAIYVADCAFEIPIDGGVSGESSGGALLVTAANGSELASRGTIRGAALDADEISGNLKAAIVAIEDRRFYEHGAIDLHGMARAFVRDALQGRAREGASTITQQLARLMLLSPDRTARRKVQEALIAFWLEHHLTKSQILARYLDTAYFGAGAYGADAAAERYFGKSARDLTVAEAAMIAGLVRAPSQLAPHRNLQGAQARAKLVVEAMAASGAITAAQASEAIAHPAVLKVEPETPSGPGYVADLAQADVKALVGDAALDLSARTTIDPDLQKAAEAAVARWLDTEGAKRHATQAAVVALGSDGAILAMVGGRDYDASTFNRATQAKRQAGSLFKLFVYMTALEKGATPQSRVVDAPIRIGDWEPHNFEERYRGPMSLESAFAHSVNTVAVALAQQVGIDSVVATAKSLGVASPLPKVPSLALGVADVTLLEMTRAFANVASDQDGLEPYLVQKITSGSKVLFNRPPRYAGDADPSQAKVEMRELLADVVREGTGRGAALAVPTGGKTGTTQDFRDAWFVGSAPELTVGVWVGNDDNSPMDHVTGGDLPVKIWRDVVVAAQSAKGERSRTGAGARTAPAAPRGDAADGRVADARAHDGVGDGRASGGQAANGGAAASPDAAGQPAGAQTAAAQVQGDADVIDTSTLSVDGREIRLLGVAPTSGRAARRLARYLRRREVDCAPAGGGAAFRCAVDGDDLATTILANGGAEATPDAPADLIAAQDAAREGRLGIWRRRR